MKVKAKKGAWMSLALTLFVGVYCGFAQAQSPDPLWVKTLAHQKALEKWAAQDVEQTMSIEKDGELKAKKLQIQLSRWEKDEAIYTVLSVEPPLEKSKPIPKPLNIDQMMKKGMQAVLVPDAPFVRKDNVDLHGINTTTFELSGGIVQKMKIKFWVNRDTGMPYQQETSISMPFSMEGNFTTSFEPDAQKMMFPSLREVKMNVLIPFKKSKIQMSEKFGQWTQQAKE